MVDFNLTLESVIDFQSIDDAVCQKYLNDFGLSLDFRLILRTDALQRRKKVVGSCEMMRCLPFLAIDHLCHAEKGSSKSQNPVSNVLLMQQKVLLQITGPTVNLHQLMDPVLTTRINSTRILSQVRFFTNLA